MPIYKAKGKIDGRQKYRVIVCYTDIHGIYHNVERAAYGLNEAKALEAQLQTEYSSKQPTSATMTLGKLCEEYLNAKKTDLRETTVNKSERTLRLYVLKTLSNARLDKLGPPILQKWKNDVGAQKIALTTKKNIYGELRTLLNYGVKMGYLPKNPLTVLGNFKDKDFTKPQDKIRYYTSDEFKKYIDVAKNESITLKEQSYYIFFNIAFYTGMRKGEIYALKWSDIENNVIHVRRSIAQKLKGGDRETPPKNKSSYRDIQMPTPLADILAKHKADWMQQAGFTEEYRICGGDAVIRDTTVDLRNRHYASLAGLPHRTIHEFRHSHATLLANNGINIQEIARRLGHSDVQQTWDTYAHLYPQEEERALKILNEI